MDSYHNDGGEEASRRLIANSGTEYPLMMERDKPHATTLPTIPRLPLSDLAPQQRAFGENFVRKTLHFDEGTVHAEYSARSDCPSPIPTPRSKRQLLAAAREKLKEVRGEEEGLAVALATATAARDELRGAIKEGVDSLAGLAGHTAAAVEAISRSIFSPSATGTQAGNATHFDPPLEATIRQRFAKQQEIMTARIQELKADLASLQHIEASVLPPLEETVSALEATFSKWSAKQAKRDEVVEGVRAAIGLQLKETKEIEEWMRGWVFSSPASIMGQLVGTAITSPLAPKTASAPIQYPSLAALLGLAKNHYSKHSERRNELLLASAAIERSLEQLKTVAKQHEGELVVTDLEEQLACNEQLLKSYRVRVSFLEKERRKRPKRSEVGERLAVAARQAQHLRSEYAKQFEELCLLQNTASAATMSYLSPQRNARGDRFNPAARKAAPNDNDTALGSRPTTPQPTPSTLPSSSHSISPVTSAVRNVLCINGSNEANDDTPKAVSPRNGKEPGPNGSTREVDYAPSNNLLGDRCRELQLALSSFRDVTLPDLRKQHGALKGAVFDSAVLEPEAWAAEESRHVRHIHTMGLERDAIRRSIVEAGQQVQLLQQQVAAKAAAASTKAKGQGGGGISGRIGGFFGFRGTAANTVAKPVLPPVSPAQLQAETPIRPVIVVTDLAQFPGYGQSQTTTPGTTTHALLPQVSPASDPPKSSSSATTTATMPTVLAGADSANSQASISALPVGIDIEAAVAAMANNLIDSSTAGSERAVGSPLSPGYTRNGVRIGVDTVVVNIPSDSSAGLRSPIGGLATATPSRMSLLTPATPEVQQNLAPQPDIAVGGPPLPPPSSVFYRIAALPLNILSVPYLAARGAVKKYAAPPPVKRQS